MALPAKTWALVWAYRACSFLELTTRAGQAAGRGSALCSFPLGASAAIRCLAAIAALILAERPDPDPQSKGCDDRPVRMRLGTARVRRCLGVRTCRFC